MATERRRKWKKEKRRYHERVSGEEGREREAEGIASGAQGTRGDEKAAEPEGGDNKACCEGRGGRKQTSPLQVDGNRGVKKRIERTGRGRERRKKGIRERER